MTTVQVNLPDALAEDARNAGLLTPKMIEKLLCEQLKKQAGEALREMWEHMPQEELTPEIEKMIDDEAKAVRAKRRKQTAS